jgi:hypothetical protein
MFPPRSVARATTTAARIVSTILLRSGPRIAVYSHVFHRVRTSLNTSEVLSAPTEVSSRLCSHLFHPRPSFRRCMRSFGKDAGSGSMAKTEFPEVRALSLEFDSTFPARQITQNALLSSAFPPGISDSFCGSACSRGGAEDSYRDAWAISQGGVHAAGRDPGYQGR